MLEHESNNRLSAKRHPETAGDETKADDTFLRIRKLQLKKIKVGTLLEINLGVDVPKEPPAVIRYPAQAVWGAVGLAARALGLELVINHEG